MDKVKTIHIINSDDADQHVGHLKGILEALKSEHRIHDYQVHSSNSFTEASLGQLGNEDMVMMFLTHGIEPQKQALEETLLKIKQGNQDVKISEVLIDNIPYEPRFMAFPADLQPIRSRTDMDAVWGQIGSSLRRIFPVVQKPVPKAATWKKYIPYILGLLAIIIGAALLTKGCKDDFKIATIGVKVDPENKSSLNCPEEVTFSAVIKTNKEGTIRYRWVKSTGRPSKTMAVKVPKEGVVEVKGSEKFGTPGQTIDGWVQLEILEPKKQASDKTKFHLECIHGVGRFKVEDVFDIQGRGTVVTGTVAQGEIKKQSNLKILSSQRVVQCASIEVGNQTPGKLTQGQEGGFLLKGGYASSIRRGDLLEVTNEAITPKLEYVEQFNGTNPNGWKGATSRTTVRAYSSSGNPGGYLLSYGQAGGGWDIGIVYNGPKIPKNFAQSELKRFSFDMRLISGNFDGLYFRVRYRNSSHNGWRFPIRTNLTNQNWKSYSVRFDPNWTDAQARTAGWTKESHSASFRETMADVYTTQIGVSGNGILRAGFDNLRLE